jgi:hypothetical protein
MSGKFAGHGMLASQKAIHANGHGSKFWGRAKLSTFSSFFLYLPISANASLSSISVNLLLLIFLSLASCLKES